ncbi:MAG TPA: hypothetical protein VLH39_07865, partial [Magnetospirillaceae bacterium]|nr:hypothetical protein [Magnetospirillaceae bacterium]
RVKEDWVHGEEAGIPRRMIEEGLTEMFSRRAFLSRTRLTESQRRIWVKGYPTSLKSGPEYLPRYAAA